MNKKINLIFIVLALFAITLVALPIGAANTTTTIASPPKYVVGNDGAECLVAPTNVIVNTMDYNRTVIGTLGQLYNMPVAIIYECGAIHFFHSVESAQSFIDANSYNLQQHNITVTFRMSPAWMPSVLG